MRYNKIIAIFLALMMVVTFLPEKVLANSQKPIQEIQKVTVHHQDTILSTKEVSITPNVQVDWIGPIENDMPTNPGNNDSKGPTYYDIAIANLHDGKNTGTAEDVSAGKFTPNAGVYSMKVEDYFKNFLLNGSLYKAELTAKHKHQVITNGVVTLVDAPLSGEKIPSAYFITDFNIQAQADNGLIFDWEYIPGVSYKLFYDKGNVNSISQMTGVGIEISAQQAKNNLSKDGKRVEWKVNDAIVGQIYSAYVLPSGIENAQVVFDDIAYNKETPKIVHATPNIPLKFEKLGESKLRLTWNINDSAWVAVGNLLHQTVIYKINAKGDEEELGRIHNENNGNIDVGYFECAMPTEEVTYRVDFILRNKVTNAIEKGFSAGPRKYIPDELKTVPYQPNIPEIFNYKEGNTVEDKDIQNAVKYKVKFNGSYDDLILTNNNISEFKTHTFHYEINEDTAQIQLVWDAPQLGTTGEVDYGLYYDIWVSESASSFKDADKVISNLKIEKGDPEHVIYKLDGTTVVGMKTTLLNLATNKTYYIKMVAKRQYADGDESISLPVIKEVSIPRTGDVYEPPVVGKPPLQVDSVSKNEINVKWAEQWYEIMAKQSQLSYYKDPVEKLLASWGHSRIYLTDNEECPIAFRDEEGKYGMPIDLYGSTIKQKLSKIDSILKQEKYILRSIDMGKDARYKVQVMKLTEADEKRGSDSLEQWVMNTDISEVKNKWIDVTGSLVPTTIEGIQGKLLNISQDYHGDALEANTAYVILISAARKVDGEWKYSTVPSYILATTQTDHQSELETPKTPRLYNYESKDVRDTEVTVRWIYNANFDYELVYSRLDDPDSAQVWEFTEDDKKTFVDGAEAYVTISALLPETTYNFWLRAKQKAELVPNGEVKHSDWSTPVTSTTLTLSVPLPPSGLGLASYKSIQEAGKDFSPSGEDYLTIEWMRNASDLNNSDPNFVYSYIVEFADNPEFSDLTVVTVTDGSAEMAEKQDKTDTITAEYISKNLIRFNGLRANMPYYVKVKTVLEYKNGDKEIIKESAFTHWVRLITNKSSNEYDGGENENVVIFDEPIKQTYTNGIWTYEIQDTAKITSEMLNKGEYYYTITMENYNNKYDANTRRVKMSKIVLDTLINQGMALKVVTNKGIYDIPGDALKNYASKYTAADKVQIDLTRMDNTDISAYGRSYPEIYESGEKLAVSIKGNAVNRFDKAIKVSLKLNVVESYKYSDHLAYQYNYASGSWTSYPYTINTQDTSYLTFSTMNTGLNAVYEKTAAAGSSKASYTMNQLSSKYNVTGMGTAFTTGDTVRADQYVRLMLGICTKSNAINLSLPPTAAEYTSAKAAGLYISNSRGILSQEQALAGIVRLYELKTGSMIKPSSMKFIGTSSAYTTAVSKAYAIGLITDIRPQQKITYGELCDWLVQVS